MSIDVVTTTVIARPRAEVAAFASDPDHDTTWIENIREVHWITDPPARVGTRVSRVAYFLGRRLAYVYEIEALVPGERLDMRAVDGPFPMTTSYAWEDVSGGTRMTIRVGGGPGGFFGLAAPLLAIQMRRALTKDLARIRAVLEAGDPALGDTRQ